MSASEPAGLPAAFYDRPVVQVARELIGCTVAHGATSGVIVETEAYHQSEPACHAYVGLTARTSTLFEGPGRAYVYRSYGIHALLNCVCEPEGTGAAVLIRALQPLQGVHLMGERRRRARLEDLCSGPGKLSQALGIDLVRNASDLCAGPIRVGARRPDWSDPPVVSAIRVGITRGTELPWRFCVVGNPHVSRPRPHADRVVLSESRAGLHGAPSPRG